MFFQKRLKLILLEKFTELYKRNKRSDFYKLFLFALRIVDNATVSITDLDKLNLVMVNWF